jgi:hypothetical protein
MLRMWSTFCEQSLCVTGDGEWVSVSSFSVQIIEEAA